MKVKAEPSSGKRRALRAGCLLLSALALTPACTMRNPAFVAGAANAKMDAAAADVPRGSDSAVDVRSDVTQDGPAPDPVDASVTDAVFDVSVGDVTPVPAGADSADAVSDVSARPTSIDDRTTGGAASLNRWNYTGPGWTWCDTCTTGETLFAGTNTWSRVAGDEATLNFQGSVVRLYGVLDPAHGIGVVSLDGVGQKDVDFYAATRVGNQLVWTTIVVGGAQTHQLRIQVTGRRRSASSDANVAIDRVEIE